MTVLVLPQVRDTDGLSQPAFEPLYHANVDAIWRFLERLGVPARNLEDATQDTFLIAHRRLGEFRGESSLKTWLHGIALRVAKDHRRTEGRKGGWEPLEPTLRHDGRAPDDAAAHRQSLSRVLALLEELDEQQRTTFVLIELEGFTAPEVAALTDTNVNTVSTRLRAARLRFNQLVAARGVHE